MDITILGKKILHSYHHYIMSIKLKDFCPLRETGFLFREITTNDIDLLKRGDFAIQNMLPYLGKEKKYSTGLLCIDETTMQPVGYIWVVRRGGKEMVYKVRYAEALLSCVCVFKEYRGNNIANTLIGGIVDLLRRENIEEVTLGVRTDNKSAIRAYQKAGFKIIDEKRYLRFLRMNFPYHSV